MSNPTTYQEDTLVLLHLYASQLINGDAASRREVLAAFAAVPADDVDVVSSVIRDHDGGEMSKSALLAEEPLQCLEIGDAINRRLADNATGTL